MQLKFEFFDVLFGSLLDAILKILKSDLVVTRLLFFFENKAPSTLRRGIWKRRFHSETHQMFPVHITPEEFKNATVTGNFGFVFEENLGTWIRWWLQRYCLQKASIVSKCFPSTRKRKAGDFKCFQFEERFRKAPFSWRISVADGRHNRENKAAFSNSSCVVWTAPKCLPWFYFHFISDNLGDRCNVLTAAVRIQFYSSMSLLLIAFIF